MNLPQEKFIGILCKALRALAWVFLVYGIIASIASSTALGASLLVNRWSGVVVLFLFVCVFLMINLVTRVAEIILKIKVKVQA